MSTHVCHGHIILLLHLFRRAMIAVSQQRGNTTVLLIQRPVHRTTGGIGCHVYLRPAGFNGLDGYCRSLHISTLHARTVGTYHVRGSSQRTQHRLFTQVESSVHHQSHAKRQSVLS